MNNKTDFIPFGLPSLGLEEENAVLNVLRSGWLTTGKITKKFEQEFAAFVGSKYALALNSATAGLHLAIEALKIKKGDYVITSPYTFTASAEILRYLGAHPLFVDINKNDLNINPDFVKKNCSNKNAKAILPIHIGGEPCKMTEIMDIAKKYSLKVIEDCAHAFPVKYNSNKYCGTIGDTGIYSFYANKTITTGEGGMLVTDNPEIAKRVSIMRLHGIDREAWNRYTEKNSSWKYEIVDAGYKYNITDIASSIGREQLKKANQFLTRRKEIAKKYIDAFKDLDAIDIPDYKKNHSWHLFIISIEKNKLNINRDEFIQKLSKAGIGTSVHYIPLHIMPYYKKLYGFKDNDFPNTLDRYLKSHATDVLTGYSQIRLCVFDCH